MEIHKPKPTHNWREFLIELGTITLGVMIALAAEQTVESLHWRARVAEARQVIATELADDLSGAIRRVRQADCVDRRLDELAAILDAASKTGRLPPIGNIGVPWRQTYPDGAWQSVIASQTATHFPPQQLADIAALYKVLHRIEEYNGQEIVPWSSLFAMVGPGRRLDAASEAKLRDALSQARNDSRSAASLAEQLITRANGLHIRFGPDDLKGILDLERDPSVARTGICAPLGAAPGTYGQGLVSQRMEAMRALVNHFPDFSGGTK